MDPKIIFRSKNTSKKHTKLTLINLGLANSNTPVPPVGEHLKVAYKTVAVREAKDLKAMKLKRIDGITLNHE